MKSKFEEGQEVLAIAFPDDSVYEIGEEPHHCKRIMVIMENGEMAPVVWFLVSTNEGKVYKINSKYVDVVRLK